MIEYVRQVLSKIEAGYEWFIVDLLGYDKAIYFEEVVLVFGGKSRFTIKFIGLAETFRQVIS